MAFGVGQVDIPIGADAEAFGAREACLQRRAAVAGETFRAGAGDGVPGVGRAVEFVDGVSLAEGEPEDLPALSKSIARGPFNGVPMRGEPSFVALFFPVPAKVLIVPVDMSILRIRLFAMSQMYRSP